MKGRIGFGALEMVFIVLAILAIAYLGGPLITGFITKEVSYSEEPSLVVASSGEYVWEPIQEGELLSLKIDGSLSNTGSAKVYLESNGLRKLVFDSTQMETGEHNESESQEVFETTLSAITGFVQLNSAPVYVGEESFEIDGKTNINLNQLFEDDDKLEYSAVSPLNIELMVNNNLLVATPDEGFSGERTAFITASDGTTEVEQAVTLVVVSKKGGEAEAAVEEVAQGIEVIENAILLEEDALNSTEPANETIIDDMPINETIANETVMDGTLSKIIMNGLTYGDDPLYDPNNDGIETLSGVVDFSIEESSFDWDADPSKLCTRWQVHSQESGDATRICYGSSDCCAFVDLAASSDSWDAPYYSTYNKHGATENNIVSSQVIYFDVNLDADNLVSDIAYSEWENLTSAFGDSRVEFSNQCLESCSLSGFNKTSYRLVFEIEGEVILRIDSIDYTVRQDVGNMPPETSLNFSNITMMKNTEFSVNLSNHFTDPDGEALSFSYYKPSNVSIVFNGTMARIVPDIGYVGSVFTFITANDSDSSVTSNIFRIDVVESVEDITQRVTVGEPVIWAQEVAIEDLTNGTLSLEIPETALNVTVDVISGSLEEEIGQLDIVVIENDIEKNAKEFHDEKKVEQLERKITLLEEGRKKGAQLVVLDGQNVTKEDFLDTIPELILEKDALDESVEALDPENSDGNITIIVENVTSNAKNAQSVVIEYVTEAPVMIQTEINPTLHEVLITSDTHYTDVAVGVDIPESIQSKIEVYWIINETRTLFSNVTYLDSNLDGMINRLEWIVPHLSNQTFEIVTDSSTQWDEGTFVNMVTKGSGNDANLTSAGRNVSGSYGSKVFDAGVPVLWKNITWSVPVPYGEEIGRTPGEHNNASVESGLVNTSGLIILLHFNNETGENNSLVKDFSYDVNAWKGAYHNATCSGTICPLYNSSVPMFGSSSVWFDGTDDYYSLTAPPYLDAPTTLTVSTWMYFSSITDDPMAVAHMQSGSPFNGFELGARTSTGKAVFHAGGAYASNALYSNTGMETNKWYHLVGVYDGTTAYIYVNGALDNSGVRTNNMAIASEPLDIGTDYNRFSFHDGLIDEISIWNRTLSHQEIKNLYLRGAHRVNLSVRTCDDALCSGESWTPIGSNGTFGRALPLGLSDNRYFQYNITYSRNDSYYNDTIVNNVSVTYVDPDILVSNCTVLNISRTYLLQNNLSTTVSPNSPCFNITTSNVTLDCQGNFVNGSDDGYGVYAERVQGITIKNCSFWNWGNSGSEAGIQLNNVGNSTINDVNTSDSYLGTVLLSSGKNNISRVTANSNGYGIYFVNGDNNMLSEIAANYNSRGFYSLSNSDFNTLFQFTANYNAIGIYLQDSDFNKISQVTANYNTQYGATLTSNSLSNNLSNISANYNTLRGIYLDTVSLNKFSNLSVQGGQYGLYIHGGLDNNISNVHVSDHNITGIHMANNPVRTIIFNALIQNATTGILVDGPSIIFNFLTINATSQSAIRIADSFVNATIRNAIISGCVDPNIGGINNSAAATQLDFNYIANYSCLLGNVSGILNNYSLSSYPFDQRATNGGFYLSQSGASVNAGSVQASDAVAPDRLFNLSTYYTTDLVDSGVVDLGYHYSTYADIALTNCSVLGIAGKTYTLLNNLSTNVSVPSGVCFNITASDVTLDCQGFFVNGSDDGYGVYAENVQRLTIKNCSFWNWGDGSGVLGDAGIFFSNVGNSTIRDVNTSLNTYAGIYLYRSSSNNISDVVGSQNGRAMYLYTTSKENRIIRAALNSNSYGAIISNSNPDNNYFANVTANSNSIGLYFVSSSNNNLINITANSNAATGIDMSSGANFNNLTNSVLNSNSQSGLYLSSSSSNLITNTTFQNNTQYDISTVISSDSHCSNQLINVTSSYGRAIEWYNYSVKLENMTFAQLILCNADGSNLTNITIDGETTKDNNGLFLYRMSNATLRNINSSDNYYGVFLSLSSTNNISNVVANSNGNDGISLNSGSSNSVRNVVANSNADAGIFTSDSSGSFYNITANGQGTGISVQGASNNFSVVTINSTSYGIGDSSTNNRYSNFLISSSGYGISPGSRNTYTNFTIIGSGGFTGMYVFIGNNFNNFTSFNISGPFAIAAIALQGGPTNNNFFNMLISNTAKGIQLLDGAANNSFSFLTINGTSTSAISIEGGSVNTTIRNVILAGCASSGGYGGINNTQGSQQLDINYVANYSCLLGNVSGILNNYSLSSSPFDSRPTNGGFYLTQSSSAVNAGSVQASDAVSPDRSFNLSTYYTTDLVDSGVVDLGYHYSTYADIALTNCSVLGIAGKTYTLLNNLSTNVSVPSGVCFNITASDVTLDCNGLFVNGTDDGYGVYASNVQGITVKNCTFTNWGNSGTESGIYWSGVGNSTLRTINVSSNFYGVYLASPESNNISEISSLSDSFGGLILNGGSKNRATNITSISSNTNIGVYGTDSFISNSYTSGGTYGIQLTGSSTVIENFTSVNPSFAGVYVTGASNNISNVNVRGASSYGVSINSNNNLLTNVTTNSNTQTGIHITTGTGSILRNSTSQNNTQHDVLVQASTDAHCGIIFEGMNLSKNQSLGYYNYSVSLENRTFAELILCNADGSNLTNITIDGETTKDNNGLFMYRTSNATLRNINSSDNYMGISLSNSNSNLIADSVTSSTTYGIITDASSNNMIVSYRSVQDGYGLWIYSNSNNNVVSNVSSLSTLRGITVESSNSNIITNATLRLGSDVLALQNSPRNNSISNIEIYDDSGRGIYMINNPVNNTLFNILISDASTGIQVDGTGNLFEFITINGTITSSISTLDSAVNATLKNIIISNCTRSGGYGGINNTGNAVNISFNYIANYSCLLGNVSGILNNYSLSSSPFDTRATNGNFYLTPTSAAVNGGDRQASDAVSPDRFFNLSQYHTGEIADEGVVDLGYHYSESASMPLTNCSRLGTAGRTYTLLNNISTTVPSNAPCFNITASGVTLDCAGLFVNGSDDGFGVYAEGVQGITIKNCSFWNWGNGGSEAGVYFGNVGNSTVRDLNASANYYGIYLSTSSQNNISDVISNTNSQTGISVTGSYNSVSRATTNSNSNQGISINNGNYNTISFATANSNNYGIYSISSSYNTLTNITVNSNNAFGLYLIYNSYNIISNATIQNTVGSLDFDLQAQSDANCNHQFENITITGGLPFGYYNYSVRLENRSFGELYLCNADGSNLTNITVDSGSSNSNNGLIMWRTSQATFRMVNSSGNYYGIYSTIGSSYNFSQITVNSNTFGLFGGTDSSTFTNITANSNGRSINFEGDSNSYTNIVVNFNSDGIYHDGAVRNNYSGVTAIGNTNRAIHFQTNSLYNKISNVTIQSGPYGVSVSTAKNNTFSNIYMSNLSVAGIYLSTNPANNTFFNTLIQNATTGILLDGSSNTFNFLTINATSTSAINTNDGSVNATVRNAIISGCVNPVIGGLNNSAGALQLDFNYISNYSCRLGNVSGILNNYSLSGYPFDQRATNGGFYLNQTLATKDGGDRVAIAAVSPDGSVNLSRYYTGGSADSGTVDLGYHYAFAGSIPSTYTNFNGRTTDFNSQGDVGSVCNAVIENQNRSMIEFKECISIAGLDFNSNVRLSNNSVFVNVSNLNPSINVSANITLFNLSFGSPSILVDYNDDGVFESCTDCAILSYANSGSIKNLTFSVSHFTSYAATESTNLSIYSQADVEGGLTPFSLNFSGMFFANYSSAGSAIANTTGNCTFSHNATGSFSTPEIMRFNTSYGNLYHFNYTPNVTGLLSYNISCYSYDVGIDNLSLVDNFTVSHLILSASFNATRFLSDAVAMIFGKINLSNGTNASYGVANIYLNGALLSANNFTDTSDSDFSQGTSINVSIYGSGNGANLTLKKNETNQYPNSTGNFTSKVFDAGGIVNWTAISWSTDAPYQNEIGRAAEDGNGANLPYMNTSGLILLHHFNNESDENGSLVKDFSFEVNTGKNFSNNLTCSGNSCPTINFSNFKMGRGAVRFDGSDDYLQTVSSSSIPTGNSARTISLWYNNLGIIAGTNQILTGYGANAADDAFYIITSTLISNTVCMGRWGGGDAPCSSTQIQTNRWYHVVVTFDGTNGRIYIDGNLEGTSPRTLSTTLDQVDVGNMNAVAGHFTGGLIDEYSFWNRSLSGDEVKNLYKRGAGHLNITTRTSNDSSIWSEWSQPYRNQSRSTVNSSLGRYLQYKTVLATESENLTPVLSSIALNYSGIFTDRYGNYNFTFNVPSIDGNYEMKVNSTYQGVVGETFPSLTVQTSTLRIQVMTMNDSYGPNMQVNLTDPPGNFIFEFDQSPKGQQEGDSEGGNGNEESIIAPAPMVKKDSGLLPLHLLALSGMLSILLAASVYFSSSTAGRAAPIASFILVLLISISVAFAFSGSGEGYTIFIANVPLTSEHTANDSGYNLSFQLVTEPIGRGNSSDTNITLGFPYIAQGPYLPSAIFDEESTDFTNEPDINNVCNARIVRTNYGKIEWKNCINAEGQDFSTRISFNQKKFVNVDSSNLHSTINTSANITFYDVQGLRYPLILKNDETCMDCTILSWNSSTHTVVFNVTGFSNYTAVEANQSKIVNYGNFNQSFSLNLKVQFFNTDSQSWVDSNVLESNTPYNLSNMSLLKLDSIFNGRWDTSNNASFGSGTYRVYAAALDSNGDVINNTLGNLVESTYNFTVSGISVPITNCTTLNRNGTSYVLRNSIMQPAIAANGACFNVTANYTTLDCNGYFVNGTDDGYGVYAANVQGLTIKNCSFWNWGDAGTEAGVYFSNVGNSTIRDVNSSINYVGIALSASNSNNISNIQLRSNPGSGISLALGSSFNRLQSISAQSNGDYGIILSAGSNNNTISDSTTVSHTTYGFVAFTGSSYNTVSSSTFLGSGFAGISPAGTQNTFINVSSIGHTRGVYIQSGASSHIFINSTIQNNSVMDFNFGVVSCTMNLTNVTSTGGRPIGVYNSPINLVNANFSQIILCNADGSNLTNITVFGSDEYDNNGLYLFSTDSARFTNINSSDNYYGVYADSSASNEFEGLNAVSNTIGLYMFGSSSNNVTGGVFTSNSNRGVYISSSSSGNKLHSINSSANTNYGFSFDSSSINNIVSNSSANSNTVYGFFFESNAISNSVINSTASFNQVGVNSNGVSNLNFSNVYSAGNSLNGMNFNSNLRRVHVFNSLVMDSPVGIYVDGNGTFEFVTINDTTTSAIQIADDAVNATFRNIVLSGCGTTRGGINNTGGSQGLNINYVANYSCLLGNVSGILNNYSLSTYPFDQRATNGGFYLNQSLSTVNGGDRESSAALSPDGSFSLENYFTSNFEDGGIADLGYHYPQAAQGFTTPATFNIASGGVFAVKDRVNRFIAVIDSLGSLNVKGAIYTSTTPAPDSNDFVVQNSTGGVIASISNPEGNLFIKGVLEQSQGSLSPTFNSFIVQNSSGQTVAYFNSTGSLRITGQAAESVVFE